MGYDGAGGYDRQRNFSADASAKIRILASAMDQEFDDFASAMGLCLLRDGQAAATGDIPMGGNRLTNVGGPASATNFTRAYDLISNIPIYMIDTESSADRISVSAAYFTTASATDAPIGGTGILVKMGSDKTVPPALHLNTGDGNPHSANVVLQNGSAIASGALYSGGIYEFIYDSADSVWQLTNPTVIIATTATPGAVELATTAEANTGLDEEKVITPGVLAGTNYTPFVMSFVANVNNQILTKNIRASAFETSAVAGATNRVTHNLSQGSAHQLVINLQTSRFNDEGTGTGIFANILSCGADSFTFECIVVSASATEYTGSANVFLQAYTT